MLKPRVTRAVWPNAGTRARYLHRMLREIGSMVTSVEYWLQAQYRGDPPELAEDAAPAEEMRKRLNKLRERWEGHFGEMAKTVAESFLRNQFKGTDVAMRQALKDAGWVVEFKMTPAMRDAFQASLAENVGLIKSIPARYFEQVEGIVMRSYSAGRDLGTMVKELKALYPKAADRAVLIARDQSNKSSAVVQRARQKELGITEAIWMHSHAGKEPRPTHVAMNGKRYKVDEGMWDPHARYVKGGGWEGAWIFPGQLVGCRCVGRSVLPFTPAEAK